MEIRKPLVSELKLVEELSLSHLPEDKRQKYFEINPKSAKLTKQIIESDTGICFVAIIDHNIVGYVLGRIKETPLTTLKFAELFDIKVKEGFRGKGIGTKLAQEFIAWSKKNANRVSVVTQNNNKTAISFYKKLGFKPQSLELEMEA